jgi:paraquat-inducible protein A
MHNSLASRHPRLNRVVMISLACSAILLAAGIFSPMMTLSKFIWIENRFSLFDGTVQLFRDGQYLLFIILLSFSILLPVIKLVFLFRFWTEDSATREQLKRFMEWLSHYGKWSMLDVFVVALLVVIVKLGVMATVEVHYGIYLYALAGILIMITTTLVTGAARNELFE